MRRSWVIAVILAIAALGPATLTAERADAAPCTVQYVIAPYRDGAGHVESSTNVVCGAPALTLYVEIELLRWTGSAWVIDSERTRTCDGCDRLGNWTEATCGSSASTIYYARARYRYPDANGWPWSSWKVSSNSTLPCS